MEHIQFWWAECQDDGAHKIQISKLKICCNVTAISFISLAAIKNQQPTILEIDYDRISVHYTYNKWHEFSLSLELAFK